MFQELKNFLILTKFILKYFDTWVWIPPRELLNFNSRQYSKSYHYYYQRYVNKLLDFPYIKYLGMYKLIDVMFLF